MIHKFFGGVTNIDTVAKLTKLGQPVELSDELAHDVREGGGAILPADVYDSIGFTQDEEKQFSTPAHAKHAPVEFLAKRHKAYEMLQAIRAGLNPLPVPAEETPESEQ